MNIQQVQNEIRAIESRLNILASEYGNIAEYLKQGGYDMNTSNNLNNRLNQINEEASRLKHAHGHYTSMLNRPQSNMGNGGYNNYNNYNNNGYNFNNAASAAVSNNHIFGYTKTPVGDNGGIVGTTPDTGRFSSSSLSTSSQPSYDTSIQGFGMFSNNVQEQVEKEVVVPVKVFDPEYKFPLILEKGKEENQEEVNGKYIRKAVSVGHPGVTTVDPEKLNIGPRVYVDNVNDLLNPENTLYSKDAIGMAGYKMYNFYGILNINYKDVEDEELFKPLKEIVKPDLISIGEYLTKLDKLSYTLYNAMIKRTTDLFNQLVKYSLCVNLTIDNIVDDTEELMDIIENSDISVKVANGYKEIIAYIASYLNNLEYEVITHKKSGDKIVKLTVNQPVVLLSNITVDDNNIFDNSNSVLDSIEKTLSESNGGLVTKSSHGEIYNMLNHVMSNLSTKTHTHVTIILAILDASSSMKVYRCFKSKAGYIIVR